MTTLPCSSNLAIFDALFEDEDPQARADAFPVAVRLCASCPAPCADKVTETSAPRSAGVEVSDDEAGVETKPVRQLSRVARASAELKDFGPWESRMYIRPADRVPVAAAEAMQLAETGLTVEQVAERLTVTVETAALLLAFDKPKPSLCCAGDRAGYLRHRWHDEEPCPASRAANSAYTREYSASHPDERERRAQRERDRRRGAA